MTDANKIYQNLILDIFRNGETTETRNSKTISNIFLPSVTFDSFPLVTIRKTAWKKAIREMEWFLDGDATCPDELLDWWNGQLDPHNRLLSGYGFQFRYSSFYNWEQDELSEFDQIVFLIKNIKEHSNSRRLILTSWNPGEMANITETNSNPNTPTTCHGTVIQFFVRHGKLHMTHYQRSAH